MRKPVYFSARAVVAHKHLFEELFKEKEKIKGIKTEKNGVLRWFYKELRFSHIQRVINGR